MREKLFHARDPQSRGADIPALTAELATLRGETIVGWKNYCAAAEKFGRFIDARLKDRPADGAVADIERQLNVRGVFRNSALPWFGGLNTL